MMVDSDWRRPRAARRLRGALAAIAAGAATWLVSLAAVAQAAPPLPPPVVEALDAAHIGPEHVSAIVVPAAGGAPLAAAGADTPMNPASTMKLLTTYATLETLGPQYRWHTRAYLDGRLHGDRLDGNLVLKGGGDPKLVIEDLAEFVRRMREAGLRAIHGDLVIDDSIYSLGPKAAPAFDGDASQPYNVSPWGMLVNFKSTRVDVRPGKRGVAVELDPPLADVAVENRVRVIRGGGCRHGVAGLEISDAGSAERPRIRVAGRYSRGCGAQSTFAAVLDHRQFAGALFKAAWRAAGGTIDGRVRVLRGAARGEPWLDWESPRTLAEVVVDVNKFSNNVMARQLLLQIGVGATGETCTPERARKALADWMAAREMIFPELVIENGSGLSRVERISAAHLAAVLQSAAASPHAELLRESLPQVGVDGTMRNRLPGEPIVGHAAIKTGTLNDASAIAGYVDAASGRRWVVVMLVNGERAPAARAAQDALLRWVYANG